MQTRKILFSIPIFIATYIFQEAVVSQFRLPGGGFSVFMIFTLVWASISSPEIAALSGFFAGFLMDISQGSSGPVGQWTLILILISYGISYFGYGKDNIYASPLGVVFFVVIANLAAEFIFIVTGVLLGNALPSLNEIALTLLGNTLWTLAMTPIFLPLFSRLHNLVFETRTNS